MTIQSYPDELDYVNAKIHGREDDKSFVVTFCQACLRADYDNYELCRLLLQIIMLRYPASLARLAMERIDSGRERSGDRELVEKAFR